MKKIMLAVLYFSFLSATAMAEQLKIELSSGNTIIVDYSGSIHKVTMEGKTDAIAGLDMQPAAGKKTDIQETGETGPKEAAVSPANTEKNDRPINMIWADPKGED